MLTNSFTSLEAVFDPRLRSRERGPDLNGAPCTQHELPAHSLRGSPAAGWLAAGSLAAGSL